MRSEPRETDANRDGRDERGRFVPGCAPGPGRPALPDFRRVVAERQQANGGSVDAVLFEMFEALRAEAAAGNGAAAKLLLDRLAPQDKGAARALSLDELIGSTLEPQDPRERVRELLSDPVFVAELDRQRPVLQVETGVPPADAEGER